MMGWLECVGYSSPRRNSVVEDHRPNGQAPPLRCSPVAARPTAEAELGAARRASPRPPPPPVRSRPPAPSRTARDPPVEGAPHQQFVVRPLTDRLVPAQ